MRAAYLRSPDPCLDCRKSRRVQELVESVGEECVDVFRGPEPINEVKRGVPLRPPAIGNQTPRDDLLGIPRGLPSGLFLHERGRQRVKLQPPFALIEDA